VKFCCDVCCIRNELVHYTLISLYNVNSLNISVNFLVYITIDNINEKCNKA
jgi:hypothetical protein